MSSTGFWRYPKPAGRFPVTISPRTRIGVTLSSPGFVTPGFGSASALAAASIASIFLFHLSYTPNSEPVASAPDASVPGFGSASALAAASISDILSFHLSYMPIF